MWKILKVNMCHFLTINYIGSYRYYYNLGDYGCVLVFHAINDTQQLIPGTTNRPTDGRHNRKKFIKGEDGQSINETQ